MHTYSAFVSYALASRVSSFQEANRWLMGGAGRKSDIHVKFTYVVGEWVNAIIVQIISPQLDRPRRLLSSRSRRSRKEITLSDKRLNSPP